MIDCDKVASIASITMPATKDDIHLAQEALSFIFPDEYVKLLRCSNGLSIVSVTSEVWLYAADELEERNRTYEVPLYAPTLLMIGHDGAGNGIFLERQTGGILRISMGSIALDDAVPLAPGLDVWVSSAFDLKQPRRSPVPDRIDVYVVQFPRDGIKTLMMIRKELGLSIPVSELRRALGEFPYPLLEDVPYQPYARICARLNQRDPCLALSLAGDPTQFLPFPNTS